MASSVNEENDNKSYNQLDLHKISATCDTLKRNPKIDFNKSDLLKLLSYMEGELQARDVVIAALKSEKVKHLIHNTQYKPPSLNDPHAALFRDNLASSGNIASRQSSIAAAQSEQDVRMFANQQLEHLQKMVVSQRQTLFRITALLKDSKDNYVQVLQELEEEKRKNNKDGDPLADADRIKLRQVVFEELEIEKNTRMKAEEDLKKLQKIMDTERAKQKQMILFLVGERKQIIMKYNEERKRSEDLAQILSEEKQRVDTIAEGLEEESKKSLRMEAELEKQLQTFEAERKLLKANIVKEEKKIKEQELEILQLRTECETLKKNIVSSHAVQAAAAGQLDDSAVISPMMSSVAKVVQPTATVSSVPVSGPTTGVARSISSGQSLRQTASIPEVSGFSTTKVAPRKITPALGSSSLLQNAQSSASTSSTIVPANSNLVKNNSSALPQTPSVAGTVATSATATATPPQPPQKKSSVMPSLGRGVPPPIPPNKPVIPPKRDPSSSRLGTAAGLLTNNTNSKEKENIVTNVVTAAAAASELIAANICEVSHTNATQDDEIQQNYQQIVCGLTNK